MTTIRVKRTPGDYTTVYTPPFNNPSLSWEARGLLAYLLTKPNDWTIQMHDLILRGPAKEHKLKGMIRELKKQGYIERIRQRKYGRFEWITNVYENPEMNPSLQEPSTIGRFSTDGGSTSGKSTDIIKNELPKNELLKTQEVAAGPPAPVADGTPLDSFLEFYDDLHDTEPKPHEMEMIKEIVKKVIKPTPQQQMVETLSLITGIDYHIPSNAKRLGKVASDLSKGGYTHEDVKVFKTWWYLEDWRGKKGEAPKLAQVSELIGIPRNGVVRELKGIQPHPPKLTEAQLEAKRQDVRAKRIERDEKRAAGVVDEDEIEF